MRNGWPAAEPPAARCRPRHCATWPISGESDGVLEDASISGGVGAPLEEGGEDERRSTERFQNLLSDFKAPAPGQRVSEVYAKKVFFCDTIKTVPGVEDVQQYLTATGGAIDRGTVEFLDLVSDNGNDSSRWMMTIRFRRFARGQDKRSVGMTLVRFDSAGQDVLNQDLRDSVGGLCEPVPALDWMPCRAGKGL